MDAHHHNIIGKCPQHCFLQLLSREKLPISARESQDVSFLYALQDSHANSHIQVTKQDKAIVLHSKSWRKCRLPIVWTPQSQKARQDQSFRYRMLQELTSSSLALQNYAKRLNILLRDDINLKVQENYIEYVFAVDFSERQIASTDCRCTLCKSAARRCGTKGL